MSQLAGNPRRRRTAALAATGLVALAGAVIPLATAAGPHASRSYVLARASSMRPGAIRHVWLIILENKSYDATFTGLNRNSYLWKALPRQGALLTNYYGTGHSSMDNYLSLVAGQAPEQDTQFDCSLQNKLIAPNSEIAAAGGSLRRNKNYGQLDPAVNARQPSGANAPHGSYGCSYPTQVPTLFNQFNAAGVTWKGYAQDLGGAQAPDSTRFRRTTVPHREAAACGGPGRRSNNPDTNPADMAGDFAPGVLSLTGGQPNDQYVAKHFPFPWFESLTGAVQASGPRVPPLNEPANGGTNCDGRHIANLDSPADGLLHDLKSAKTTPAFSWITPDICSDAHDAQCVGNNLSGAFRADGRPDYHTPIPGDPESTIPRNYTGGLYAADEFLRYYVPKIEQSPAFRQGGLIDITFDEANPPFTYTGNSFNNANDYPPTRSVKPDAAGTIIADAAGENLHGRNVHFEPTGPNSTLGTNPGGDQLYPGPGDNDFIDRPPACTTTAPRTPSDCVPGIVAGQAGSPAPARTDSVAGVPGSSVISDNSIIATDTGREVTGAGIPPSSFVGAVTDTGPNFPNSPPSAPPSGVTTGSFRLVSQNGQPVRLAQFVSSIRLSPEGNPADLQPGQTPDPLFDATDPTPGGGATGSVLISPYIRPGTVSRTFYNHYSWLATMEDLFQVSRGHDHQPLRAGTVSGGLDGLGHLGYAAQPGLRPFGADVFTNPAGGRAAGLPAARSLLRYRGDRTLTGTVRHPALASEGDAVRVRTRRWSVRVTVTGPQVPGEGLPFQAPATTCTWTVTMSGATGPVPVRAGDFTSIDHLGTVYRTHLVRGQPEPPRVLLPGQRLRFELRAVQAVGEGLMRWSPGPHRVAARWDFEVEND